MYKANARWKKSFIPNKWIEATWSDSNVSFSFDCIHVFVQAVAAVPHETSLSKIWVFKDYKHNFLTQYWYILIPVRAAEIGKRLQSNCMYNITELFFICDHENFEFISCNYLQLTLFKQYVFWGYQEKNLSIHVMT